MTGVVTYACVLATAFSAFDRDFDVILATDAVGSWKEDLGAKTADIVDLLLGVAVPASEIRFRRGRARPELPATFNRGSTP
jgi:nicotinamidase-related amidase